LKVAPIQTNFTRGELSPRMEGRIDLAHYANGLRTLENCIVHPHGGATKRPGTRFIAKTRTSADRIRLIPFIFNEDQAYVIEMGDQYFRFFYDQGVLLDEGAELVDNGGFSSATSGWAPLNSAVLAIAASGVSGNCLRVRAASTTDFPGAEQEVSVSAGEDYHFQLQARQLSGAVDQWWYRLWDQTNSGIVMSADLKDLTSTWAAASGIIKTPPGCAALKIQFWVRSFGGDPRDVGFDSVSLKKLSPYEVSSPFSLSQLAAVKFAQTGDKIFFAHQSHAPCTLDRAGHVDWTVSTLSFTGLPSQWSASNYPGAVGFFEQRLWYGGTPKEPQTIWATMNGDFYNFTQGVDDDDGLEWTMASEFVNRIKWLVSHRLLVIGTIGSEWTAGAASSLDPISPTNVRFHRESTYGTNGVQGRLIGPAVLFLNPTGRKMWEFIYSADSDGYQALDLTLLAQHITKGGVNEFAYAQDPDGVIYAVRADGVLLAMTYYRAQEVFAWSRLTTLGEVESVCTIPGPDRDQVWLSVKRTAGGAEQRFIELMEGEDWESVTSGFFVDAGLTFYNASELSGAAAADPVVLTAADHHFEVGDELYLSGISAASTAGEGLASYLNDRTWSVAAVTSATITLSGADGSGLLPWAGGGTAEKWATRISGLDHLEGRTVAVCGDGAAVPDQVVSGGEVTLPLKVRKAHIGLPYTANIETMRMEPGARDGTSQGRMKRILGAVVRFYRTVGAEIGMDQDHLDTVLFRGGADLPGKAVQPFSGDKDLTFDSTFEREGRLWIRNGQPLPMTVLAIMPIIEVYGQ